MLTDPQVQALLDKARSFIKERFNTIGDSGQWDTRVALAKRAGPETALAWLRLKWQNDVERAQAAELRRLCEMTHPDFVLVVSAGWALDVTKTGYDQCLKTYGCLADCPDAFPILMLYYEDREMDKAVWVAEVFRDDQGKFRIEGDWEYQKDNLPSEFAGLFYTVDRN